MPIYLRVRRRQGDDLQGGTYDYAFDQDEVLIGRSDAVDVQLPDGAVSLVHARLLQRGERLCFVDLDSTNGSSADGRPVLAGRQVPVGVGSTVLIGPFELCLVTAEDLRRDEDAARDTGSYARQMVLDMLRAVGGDDTAALEVITGSLRGHRLALPPGCVATVGRGETCDLQLADDDASRRHVELRADQGQITAVDLGSKNGLLINDVRVHDPTVLRNGDRLLVGKTVLRFVDPADEVLASLKPQDDGQGRATMPPDDAGDSLAHLAGGVTRSGELRVDPGADAELSANSAFELGQAASVLPAPQGPTGSPKSPRSSAHTDLLVFAAGGLLVFAAVALIIYLLV